MPNSEDKYVIGVDYGTLSGRALLVRVSDGAEIATSVFEYPHAVIEDTLPASGAKLPPDWALQVPADYVVIEDTLPASGAKLPPDWALQVPADYVEVLKRTVPDVLKSSGINPAQVIGITTDFTACTILPVKNDGTPL
ncbi:MAG: hypothetical protein RL581_1423 [Actinomycetota bacterium]